MAKKPITRPIPSRRWHVVWKDGEVSLQGAFSREDAEIELKWAMSEGATIQQFELIALPVVPKKRKAK